MHRRVSRRLHPRDRPMLVIDPEECIDCGACEPECPVEAIYPEDAVPDKWEPFIRIDYLYSDGIDAVNAAVAKQIEDSPPPQLTATELPSLQPVTRMTLELVVGPVRSGKLGVLLDRFAAACPAGRRPLLIVPAAFKRDALEREACAAAGAVLGGEVVTLDGLVERVLGGEVAVASEALERVVAAANRHSPTERSWVAPGRARLRARAARARVRSRRGRAGGLERAPAGRVAAPTAYAAYEEALEACGRRAAAGSRRARPNGWSGSSRRGGGEPVFAYGFDDVSAAQLGCWPRSPAAAACGWPSVRAGAAAARHPRGSLRMAGRARRARRRARAGGLRSAREPRRPRAGRVLGPQRVTAGGRRCRPAGRGRRDGRRGERRRSGGVPAPAAWLRGRRGAGGGRPTDTTASPLRQRSNAPESSRAGHERAPHEPARRSCAALRSAAWPGRTAIATTSSPGCGWRARAGMHRARTTPRRGCVRAASPMLGRGGARAAGSRAAAPGRPS